MLNVHTSWTASFLFSWQKKTQLFALKKVVDERVKRGVLL